MHSQSDHLRTLEEFIPDEFFNIDTFKKISLLRSQAAARRESVVFHRLENLVDGTKALITISNYLGGQYFLTADELYQIDDRFIIQESKHSTRDALPKLGDIQDGLFKLILFANLDQLTLNGVSIPFSVQLKLTGNLKGRIRLPSDEGSLVEFFTRNVLKQKDRLLIHRLNQEAQTNSGIRIAISGVED